MSRLIITCCYVVEAVLIAVFVGGLSSCLILLVSIYIGEISQESIRGTTTSCSIFFMTTGALISYILGGILQYTEMNYVYLSMMVLGALMMNLVKESPMFLMKKGEEDEAAKAVAHYRGVSVDSAEVYRELENMRKALCPEFEAVKPEEEALKADSKPNKLSFLQFIRKSRSTRRAFFVCLFLYMAACFQGLIVVQVYASFLFEEAVPNISVKVTSVLFAIVSMIATFIAAVLMDRLGRRTLMIYGSIATCACCVAIGIQIHQHWGPHWLTPVLIYMYCLTYFCGAGTVPHVIVAEVFLPEVRSYVSVIAMEWFFVCNFLLLFSFNPLVATIGIGSLFYLFGGVCFISAIVSAICLPETKGLTVDVIQTKFEMQW